MPVTATSAAKAAKDGAEKARLGCRTSGSAVYRRRRPERSVLFRTVQEHLATWLALHDDGILWRNGLDGRLSLWKGGDSGNGQSLTTINDANWTMPLQTGMWVTDAGTYPV